MRTDPLASPTGFPFKVANLPGTVALEDVYASRPRICDLGYLREAYRTDDGTIGYRCAAEPVSLYVDKGGDVNDTVGRKCICNALMATAGYPQIRAGKLVEAGIVTSGDALVDVAQFLPPGADGYTAADVVRTLLGVPVRSGRTSSGRVGHPPSPAASARRAAGQSPAATVPTRCIIAWSFCTVAQLRVVTCVPSARPTASNAALSSTPAGDHTYAARVPTAIASGLPVA